MKVLVATYGSRGDVQPYVALGKGLQAAGHEVIVATSERFRDFVVAHGLPYGFLSDKLLAIIDTDLGRTLMETTDNLFQVARRLVGMARQVGPLQRTLVRDGWVVAKSAAPDLIVFHPKVFGGPHYAEKLGVPAVLALPIPLFVPTAARPSMGFPDLNLGGRYNRATYVLTEKVMEWSIRGHVRRWRTEQGLVPHDHCSILKTPHGRPLPVLHAVSRHVVPRPPDWPDQAMMTGYWFLDQADRWRPPAELKRFLDSGPPPVYVGFGSMAGRSPARMGRIVMEALAKAGVRGVVATGWGGVRLERPSSSVMVIDQVPHDWILPRVAAAVHHGGAGTVAATLRAGVPSVVVPFFGDQPFWGKRVHALGAAARPIPRKRLTAAGLAAAIREVLDDPGFLRRAQELGEKIRRERGVENAVQAVEKLLHQL
ncbi:sterol 3beta-glucosyltransferase [Desulfacinum infernum DSM 9756]|uniref:Sterol 3beta-glucosyltransferase n=1 Tax=Desulfacinum infernum DSM 9756 TaxID=1121391 RepID=A0A1M4X4W3_9BACT|nr:glycosyltransferase [Desulfacinum infernum]SHE88403.1 sterol 3beta-glucosyltransferase [Desulfacinum infernum DSM 9756]